jgi:5-methylcytosine-specific restriction protein A
VPFGQQCPKHPRSSFADKNRGSRQERGYDAEWDRKRAEILRRDQGLCQPCLESTPERVTRATQVDHIVSKAKAKQLRWTRAQVDADANLQSICDDCHREKTKQDALDGRDDVLLQG